VQIYTKFLDHICLHFLLMCYFSAIIIDDILSISIVYVSGCDISRQESCSFFATECYMAIFLFNCSL